MREATGESVAMVSLEAVASAEVAQEAATLDVAAAAVRVVAVVAEGTVLVAVVVATAVAAGFGASRQERVAGQMVAVAAAG